MSLVNLCWVAGRLSNVHQKAGVLIILEENHDRINIVFWRSGKTIKLQYKAQAKIVFSSSIQGDCASFFLCYSPIR